MKKILSAFLMVVVTLQVSAVDVLALGMNQVMTDKRGGKTYFISSDKIGEYLEQLESESGACWQEYYDWHGETSWKGKLINLLPLGVTIGFSLFYFSFMKLYNRYKRKQLVDNTNTDVNDRVNNDVVDTSLSKLQIISYFLTLPILSVLAFNISRKKSDVSMAFNCDRIQSNNEFIVRAVREQETEMKTYGLEINCDPVDPLLGYAECLNIQSQKRYYE